MVERQLLLCSLIGLLAFLFTGCEDDSGSNVSVPVEVTNPTSTLAMELALPVETVLPESLPVDATPVPPSAEAIPSQSPVLPAENSSMSQLYLASRWEHDTTSPVSNIDFISLDGGPVPDIVAATTEGRILTLNKDERSYWEMALSEPLLALATSQLYGSAYGDVAASTEMNGIQLLEWSDIDQKVNTLWQYEVPGNVTTLAIEDSRTGVSGSRLLAGTDAGQLLLLDASVPPQSTTPLKVGDTAVRLIELIPNEAESGSAAVLTEAGILSYINEEGEIPWQVNLETPTSQLIAADLNDDGQLEILAGMDNGEVIAFDQEGAELWRWRSEYSIEVLAPVQFEDGSRVLVSSDGQLAALSSSGTGLWRYQLSDSQINSVDIYDVDEDGQNEIYAGGEDGTIWILDENGRIRGLINSGTPLNGLRLINIDGNSPQPELVVWGGSRISLFDVTSDSSVAIEAETFEPEVSEDQDIEIEEVPLGDLPHYSIDVELDIESHRAEVQQVTSIKNTSFDTWDELVFHIAPDYWQNIFVLHEIVVDLDGEPTPVDKKSGQIAKLHIPLPRPIDPGEEVKVAVNFTLNLPQLNPVGWGPTGNAGWGPGIIQMGDWYPALVPYQSGSGWQTWQYKPVGDPVISRLADYDVAIHPSTSVHIAAPGHQQDLEDGGQRFRLDGARAFSFLTSPDYVSQVGLSNDDVPITVYTTLRYYDAGTVVLNTAIEAMNLFSKLYGPYPYEELIIAENGFLTAMEYSGLVSLSGFAFDSYNGTAESLLVAITAHEVAHQWWYGAVGNDQVHEPWIDEGLSMMSELLYYENYHQELIPWWWDFRVKRWNPEGPVNRSIYEFSDSERFVHNVYGVAAYFMDELRNVMGQEAFLRFLQDLQEQHRNGFVSGEEFFAAVKTHTDAEIEPLIQEYFSNEGP